MYKDDLALNNRKWSICCKTKPTQTKLDHVYSMHMYKEDLALFNRQWLKCRKAKKKKKNKPKDSRVETHYQMEFSLQPGTPLFILYILHLANRMTDSEYLI